MKIFYLLGLAMLLTSAQITFSQNKKDQSLAIYLLPKNIKSSEPPKLDLKKLKPQGKPLIHQDDILYYNKDRHEFGFYIETGEKISKRKNELRGRTFAVFVGKEAIYVGAFWLSIWSQSFSGVTLNLSNLEKESSVLTLELGYPTPKFFKGEDLRTDSRILNAFEKVKKLYEDLEVIGKCKDIKPTYKHMPSQIFTFEITKVLKGNFAQKEISFEVQYFRSNNNSEKLRDELRKDDTPTTSEDRWTFDKEKELILRFQQQVGVAESFPQIIDWKIKK